MVDIRFRSLLTLLTPLTLMVLAGLSAGPPGGAAAAAETHPPGGFSHHPDIRVELWAREPLVVDPVALAFAPDGACYVVEMRDYPLGVDSNGAPGGTVRRLRDTDGDGSADESVLFAEGLSFPTSVLPWGDGVLVCAPPEILHLADTDGDGRADRRRVVLDGLVRGVTDSNANSLRFGVDGLVHLANGGNGGRVAWRGGTADGEPGEEAGGPAAPLDLRGADLAFDPDRGRLRRTFRTGGGFGLVSDDAGHSFTTYNIDHLLARIVPVEQVERARDVEPFLPTAGISDHGASAPLFPVSVAATRPNHPEQAGRFSSSGGMGFLDGSPFADRLASSALVCDVVTNLVHRDRLVDDGAVFRGSRAPEETDCEFLASPDPAFRPVAIEPGPDGALYLADMQRDVIEHPDYIPAAVKARLDLRAGHDRGRIYRILPAAGLPAAGMLAAADPQALVADLGHPFRWRRDTAHRLLVAAFPTAATEALRAAVAGAGSPVARQRAWRILAATARLGPGDPARAAADPSPEVREAAVALAADDPATLVRLLDDPAPRVRFAAALALDGIDADGKADALSRFLADALDDPWARRALLLAADGHAPRLLEKAWRRAGEWAGRTGLADTLLGLAHATAANDPAAAGMAAELLAADAGPDATVALLRGLARGWRRTGAARPAAADVDRLLAVATRAAPAAALLPAAELAADFDLPAPPALAAAIEGALRTVTAPPERAPASAPDARLDSIRLLAATRAAPADDALARLISPVEPPEIQAAAIDALGIRRAPGLGVRLVEAWRIIDPSIRPGVVARLVNDRQARDALLDAIEAGAITLGELNLDLEQRRELLDDARVGARAAALFDDDEYGGRAAIVEDWLARLPAEGDATAGAATFRLRCAGCHVVGGIGHRVGPDLEALSHRSVEDLVTHVLDPNMAINPGYVACVVETADGRVATGLLVSRSAESVVVRRPGGDEAAIPADEIEDLRVLSTSLMPEGLEQGLSPADLRDLVAFLQRRPQAP